MDSKTYIANAIRTESVPTELLIEQTVLHATLEIAIAAGQLVDAVKRRLYYGKEIDTRKFAAIAIMLNSMSNFFASLVDNEVDLNNPIGRAELLENLPDELHGIDLANLDPRALHAALGVFSESSEVVELIKFQYEGKGLDPVKFADEMGGDVSWYQAVGLDAVKLDLDDCREKNIAKLRVRFPEKFDAEQANNRDLAAERKALEG